MNCGIDPGRWKIGIALSEDGKLLFSAVIPRSELGEIRHALNEGAWSVLGKWCLEGSVARLDGKLPDKVFIGDGTSSEEIKKILGRQKQIETVDERGSTLEGRRLYWKLHPPAGLWRFVPLSLRTPPRDIDDLAAWAIIKE
jgi:RNase H-fold protein (predicted Holliday junction resolvase)